MSPAENRDKKRIINARRNVSVATVVMIFSSIFMYLERIVFVANMPIKYLGLYSLFTNLFNYLSIVDLGINGAIMFCLYEPIVDNNYSMINSIMRFVRKVYIAIGSFIVVAGLVLTFFLKYLVQPSDMVEGIKLFFIIFILSQASTYFFGYKSVLLDANQDTYITTTGVQIGNCVQLVLQMAIIAISKNYYFYLLILLVMNILKYLVIAAIANSRYPYIRQKYDKEKIPRSIYTRFRRNSIPLFLHKFGKTIINSTDTIILSAFFGATLLGKYNNYILLSNFFMTMFWMLSGAITPSIGDMCVGESGDKMLKSYNQFFFANFMLSSFSGILFTVLSQSFVSMSFSSANILSMPMVYALGASLYLNSIRVVNSTFRDALGLYAPDWYKPIIEAIFNIVVSILLSKLIGPVGVIVGTILTYACISVWIESYVVIKIGFKKSIVRNYLKTVLYMAAYAVMVFVAVEISDMISVRNYILQMIINAFVALCVSAFAFLLFSFGSQSARATFNKLKNIIIPGALDDKS